MACIKKGMKLIVRIVQQYTKKEEMNSFFEISILNYLYDFTYSQIKINFLFWFGVMKINISIRDGISFKK